MIASASACDPRISVVIPCRDRIGYLKRALKSVFQQTVEPGEIIVVDDGSENLFSNLFRKNSQMFAGFVNRMLEFLLLEIREFEKPPMIGSHS